MATHTAGQLYVFPKFQFFNVNRLIAFLFYMCSIQPSRSTLISLFISFEPISFSRFCFLLLFVTQLYLNRKTKSQFSVTHVLLFGDEFLAMYENVYSVYQMRLVKYDTIHTVHTETYK